MASLSTAQSIVLAILVSILSYVTNQIYRFVKLMKVEEDSERQLDLWYAKNREQPFYDVRFPLRLLPSQTHVLDYGLWRKMYKNTSTFDAKELHRYFNVDIHGLPSTLLDPSSSDSQSLSKIERILHHTLSPLNLSSLVHSFNTCIAHEVTSLKETVSVEGQKIELHRVCYEAMVRASAKAFFGSTFPLDGLPEMIRTFEADFQGIYITSKLPWPIGALLRWTVLRKGIEYQEKLRALCLQFHKNGLAEDASLSVKKVRAVLEETGWTEESCARFWKVLLFVLSSNLSDSVAWTMVHILQSPSLFRQIKSEITTLPSQSTLFPNYTANELTTQLATLLSAFHETMRLRASPAMGRVAKQDTVLSSNKHEVPIKKGTILVVPTRSLHVNEKVWKEPFVFDGTRFVRSEGKERVKDLYYFGAGATHCAGRHVAIAAVLSTITMILLNFEFDVERLDIRMKEGQKMEGQRLEVDDVGERGTARWTGRENSWKSNISGVWRAKVCCPEK
ncbi:cytochrome P450 [Atractiella rhizophila]|nr:cytochrome P450 [Atractiella rhizophila]